MKDQHNRSLDELIGEFQEHLERTRGSCSGTSEKYARHARMFLQRVFGDGPVDVAALAATDVIRFITSLVSQYRPKTIKHYSVALRALFRFLRMEGLRKDRLDNAVPSVVERRLTGLPRYLDEEQHQEFLSSLDSSTPRTRRDRAIILCVARLGLRATEVAAILLDDIDWRGGVLHIRTRKTGRGALLPLPFDVGRAIVEYLRNGRPPTTTRNVFVLHHIRTGAPATPRTVYDAVRVALDRSAIEAPIRGSNLLRHTLATRLIRHGASLKEIADLLGHRRLETTQIYAKLDLPSLNEVTLPWPEVRS